jgi:maleate isomerase
MSVYGFRARIGYTSPPMLTEVFPIEWYAMAPKGMSLVVTSLAILSVTTEAVDESYQMSLRIAKEMGRSNVDLVVLGGLPINASQGADKVDDLIKTVADSSGVPVTTSLTAQVNALRAVGASKIAQAHPMSEDLDDAAAGPLREHGFNVIGSIGADVNTAYEWGRMSIETALELARQVKKDYPEADTIWFPCPHWPTAEMLETVEQELGVNAISASQAIVWEAMRKVGIEDKIEGYGRLMRDF